MVERLSVSLTEISMAKAVSFTSFGHFSCQLTIVFSGNCALLGEQPHTLQSAGVQFCIYIVVITNPRNIFSLLASCWRPEQGVFPLCCHKLGEGVFHAVDLVVAQGLRLCPTERDVAVSVADHDSCFF